MRADPVGQAQVVAVGALRQIAGLERVVGATSVSATFANFLFWKRCHLIFLSIKIPAGGQADRIIRIWREDVKDPNKGKSSPLNFLHSPADSFR